MHFLIEDIRQSFNYAATVLTKDGTRFQRSLGYGNKSLIIQICWAKKNRMKKSKRYQIDPAQNTNFVAKLKL